MFVFVKLCSTIKCSTRKESSQQEARIPTRKGFFFTHKISNYFEKKKKKKQWISCIRFELINVINLAAKYLKKTWKNIIRNKIFNPKCNLFSETLMNASTPRKMFCWINKNLVCPTKFFVQIWANENFVWINQKNIVNFFAIPKKKFYIGSKKHGIAN